MLESGFVELKLDWAATKSLSIGAIVLSDEFSAGGHTSGGSDATRMDTSSTTLMAFTESKNVRALFEAFLMCVDGTPSKSHTKSSVQVYPPEGFDAWGFSPFVKRADLESSSSNYVKDGHVTFMFGVIVLRSGHDGPIAVPSSDMGDHLGHLLDSADGSDVSFDVAGEEFHAHRAVLAARSPVFKAQLLGSMAEAKMSRVTLHNIKPSTFQVLLRFMYTDKLPTDKELEETSSSAANEVFEDLLADMFQLDRLNLMCAQKLWERVSAENVAAALGCAETHSCPELKNRCLDFFVVEKNFKVAVLTEAYYRLMHSFPSVIDEIRERVQSKR
ncbi:hypothetical protein HU200_009297 [Digitaria exilis]|uniref:BTB domain-containing protein n=1 Tax=Digitaria exilis TaxID=1010633 RepID=A0A835FLV2_9POAL|nr:hypothetical protein HU200_009297 [Digitaria exilis]